MPWSRIKRWWKESAKQRARMPFEVMCACGYVMRGERKRHFQVVSCLGCGTSVFVLGEDPWSPGSASIPNATPKATWRRPVLAAAVTFAVVATTCILTFWYFGRTGGQDQEILGATIRTYLEEGKKALREEKFQIALQKFQQAEALRLQTTHVLSPEESHAAAQQRLQAALLADLLKDSLAEMVQAARELAGPREDEWVAHFERRYQGRAVILDDVVRRDPNGQFLLATTEIRVSGERVRLELDDVLLLKSMAQELPLRILFGVRLAAVQREPPGQWVIRFMPESGVLITEDAAVGCCPAPFDEEFRELLARQSARSAKTP